MLLERFDKDGNGQLDVTEFVGFYAEAKAMYEVLFFFLIHAELTGITQSVWVCLCYHFLCTKYLRKL